MRYEWRLTVTSPFQPVGVTDAEGIHDHREVYAVITVGPLNTYGHGLVSLSWCCSSLGSHLEASLLLIQVCPIQGYVESSCNEAYILSLYSSGIVVVHLVL